MKCPLCHFLDCIAFASAHGRDYFRCSRCELTFVDPAQRPAPADEQAHYSLHQNDPNDPGYRRFLDQLATPLCSRLNNNSEGLDFGCGPGPALARMLEERGHKMWLYDPLYAPDTTVLNRQYDFVTCTEVVEHFHHPDRDMATLTNLVKPGGWLAIMTSQLDDHIDFSRWHYARDPTHVCFYRERTFQWLVAQHALTMAARQDNVTLMRRNNEGGVTG
ncbi:MAG: class I SAM-dependent methyltransferase [Alcanivoracaceae bacterium]